jgi:hypothetical protein
MFVFVCYLFIYLSFIDLSFIQRHSQNVASINKMQSELWILQNGERAVHQATQRRVAEQLYTILFYLRAADGVTPGHLGTQGHKIISDLRHILHRMIFYSPV